MSRIELITNVGISLPDWLVDDINQGRLPERLATVEEQMALAINLSRRNAEQGTGGPFGTVIVETESGLLKGVGVNRVVPLNCPLYHGEMVAIAMAHALVKSFTLRGPGMPKHTLVTSAQPCAMCCGAIPWSGVFKVVFGATSDDVKALTGFDEGPIHPEWEVEYGDRDIVVDKEVLRQQACEVLDWYKHNQGVIYNSR